MLALKFSFVVLILSSFLILVIKCQYAQFYDSTQNMAQQHNMAIQQAQNQMPGMNWNSFDTGGSYNPGGFNNGMGLGSGFSQSRTWSNMGGMSGGNSFMTQESSSSHTVSGPDGRIISYHSTGPRRTECINNNCVDTSPGNSNYGSHKPLTLTVGEDESVYSPRPHPNYPIYHNPFNIRNRYPNRYPSIPSHDHTDEYNTPGIERPTIRPEAECKESVTTVNGIKEKCAGRLIFSSDFNDGISRNWSNVVLLNDDIDEEEFTVFDNDRRNIYTDAGSLVIKPKLLNDEYGDGFPVDGKLDLKGRCTSDSRKYCEKDAVGAQILPPVVSARITTKNSFSFRYGIVEINAKLPRGDWVVPEIWLLPKYLHSTKNSGKIVIAQSLGNDDIKLNDISLNHTHCFVKLYAGEKLSNFSVIKTNGSWSDGYTSFQIGWHPDGIIFGINDNIQYYWNSTTSDIFMKGESDKIAPFNDEFYLVLGVHVGGVSPYEFPEGIINRGRSKPWKNNGASRMMAFYQDKANWLRTWDERTALRVDSVKVWSL